MEWEGKCGQCKKSQAKRDAERRVAEVEAMGWEDGLMENDLIEAEAAVNESEDKWCCMYKVMSSQEDFVNEKYQLKHDLEARGHVCLFLLKFNCELNLIELLWGYMKYCELLFSLNHLIIYSIDVTGYHNTLMFHIVLVSEMLLMGRRPL
jgi:hypothetical protein